MTVAVHKPSYRGALKPVGAALLLLVLWATGVAAAAAVLGRPGLLALILVPVLPGLFFLLLAVGGILLEAAVTTYQFNEHGVRVRRAFLSTSETGVRWEKVTDIVEHRGALDRMLGLGGLTIVAYGAHGTSLQLHSMLHARALREWAADRMDATASLDRWFGND